MENILLIITIVLCLVGDSVKAEDCVCDTLDGKDTNFVCQPPTEFYNLGLGNKLTNQGSDLHLSFNRNNMQTTFDGLDVTPNGDIIYESGQTDYDVYEPVKTYFTTSGSIDRTFFALRVGRNDANIRAHFAKILADPELVNNTADSIAKLIKKFAAIPKIKMPILGEYKMFF